MSKPSKEHMENVVGDLAMKIATGNPPAPGDLMQGLYNVLGPTVANEDNTRKFFEAIESIRNNPDADPQVQEAAIKVAIYHNCAPRDVSQNMIPDVLADYAEKYASKHGTKSIEHIFEPTNPEADYKHITKKIKNADLAKNIEIIASIVINKDSPQEMEALKDVSGKIAQATIDRANNKESKGWTTSEISTSFKEKIKGAWKSFTQKLESLTAVGSEKNKVRDSIENFVLGKSQTMKHRETITPPTPNAKNHQPQKSSGRL